MSRSLCARARSQTGGSCLRVRASFINPFRHLALDERRPDQRFFEVRRIINGSRGYYDAAKVTLNLPRRAGLSLACLVLVQQGYRTRV